MTTVRHPLMFNFNVCLACLLFVRIEETGCEGLVITLSKNVDKSVIKWDQYKE